METTQRRETLPQENGQQHNGTASEAPPTNGTSEQDASSPGTPYRKIALFALLAVVLVGGGLYGWNWYQYAEVHESTDNAKIEGNISPVLPRVDGYVERVLVDDNEQVEKGQLLAQLDSSNLANNVQQARAALKQARTHLQSAQAQVQVAQAQAQTARTQQQQAETEQHRQGQLEPGVATTQQAYDNAQAQAESAQAQYAAARRQVGAAQAGVAQARAEVKQRQAALDNAKLQLSYTKIKAPSSGRVSKKDVQPGEYVQPGQPIMSIADDGNVWVVANFKEGQIAQIHEGEPVTVEVDAYEGHTFHGKVQSIAGATGSQFALLPPDNASGNFVKVEQRVPVKIVFTDPPDPKMPLLPGLNAEPHVRTQPEEGGAS